MPRFNERTHSKTKVARLEELFEAIKDSRDPLMQEVATYAKDSLESESSQYDPSDSDKNVSNAQREYDRQRIAARSIGTTADSFDKNRAEVMRDSRHDDSLTKLNAERSKDHSSFERHPDQSAMDSHIVFRQEHMAKYR